MCINRDANDEQKYVVKLEEYKNNSENDAEVANKIQGAINEVIVNVALSELAGDENVVRCFGAYLSTERVFIVQEYMENGCLLDFVKKKSRCEEVYCKYILYNITRALRFIHSKGVLHRDLKSANVLVGSQGELKVCDFGLSRKTRND